MKKLLLITTLLLNAMICHAQPEGTHRLICGGYEVFTIASGDKDYQPASLYYGTDNADKEKVDALAPDGKVPTAMNCFTVKTPEGYIMFDTGLPAHNGGMTIERMASLGITPGDIKAIYLTHSHFDHIGGLLDKDDKAVFSNATVYVPAKEDEYMAQTMADKAVAIKSAYAGRYVTFDPGEILPGNILPIAAPGHTPGHTAYQLGQLLFVGDLMHGQSIQLRDMNICARYDSDRSKSIASRRTILSYATSNSLTTLGAHIPLDGVISR